jgi:hypothetical protein
MMGSLSFFHQSSRARLDKDQLVHATPGWLPDWTLPDVAVSTVGSRPEMNLDRPVPDSRPAEESINLNLIEFIDAAVLDRVVGLIDQPPDASSELLEQGLGCRIRQASLIGPPPPGFDLAGIRASG